jgi:hypothetical protein
MKCWRHLIRPIHSHSPEQVINTRSMTKCDVSFFGSDVSFFGTQLGSCSTVSTWNCSRIFNFAPSFLLVVLFLRWQFQFFIQAEKEMQNIDMQTSTQFELQYCTNCTNNQVTYCSHIPRHRCHLPCHPPDPPMVILLLPRSLCMILLILKEAFPCPETLMALLPGPFTGMAFLRICRYFGDRLQQLMIMKCCCGGTCLA